MADQNNTTLVTDRQVAAAKRAFSAATKRKADQILSRSRPVRSALADDEPWRAAIRAARRAEAEEHADGY